MKADKEFNKKFGQRVKFFRVLANMTQAQLAEKLELEPSTMSYIENGKNNISYMKLPRLCKILNIYPHQLFLFDNTSSNDVNLIDDINRILTSYNNKQIKLIHKIAIDIANYSD